MYIIAVYHPHRHILHFRTFALGIVGIFTLQTGAIARDADVHAGITTRLSAAVNGLSRLDLGEIGIYPAHQNRGLGLGQFSITGDKESFADISCTEFIQLQSTDGITSVSLSHAELALERGTPVGHGAKCRGVKLSSVTVDMSLNPVEQIYIGGRVEAVPLSPSTDQKTNKDGDRDSRRFTVRVTYH